MIKQNGSIILAL